MQSSRHSSGAGTARRPAAGSGGGLRDPSRKDEPKTAAEVDRDAKTAVDSLKEILARGYPPWVKDVEERRKRARNLYLTLLFNHPLSPLAQSLDALWLGTTHTLITAYRQAVAAAESEALAQSQVAVPQGPAGGGGGGGGGGKRRAGQGQGQNQIQQQQQAVQVELRKRLTRFRQALLSEEEFYRHLISRIVRFYSLQPLTKASLAEVGIGSGIHNDDEQREGDEEEGLAPIGEAERKEKVKLVYKGLICLGDLERYKEQYSEKFRREGKESRAGRKEEMYGRAKVYYDVARSLIHDDGSAYNQLAVISTYTSDDFSTVYYYFRAMAIKQAFKGVEDILDKFMRKLYERWNAVEDDRDGGDKIELFKREFLVMMSLLFRKTGLSQVTDLRLSAMPVLDDLLRSRQLPSETIVKLTAIVIGSHWHARAGAAINETELRKPSTGKQRHEAEAAAIEALLDTFGTFSAVATSEVEDVLRSEGFKGIDDSALALDDELDPLAELAHNISAPLRRILPSLRIISKWLKLHLEYLARYSTARQPAVSEAIASFWQRYTRLIGALANLFPITQLPQLTRSLEEDRDMKGFMPLSRGMTTSHGCERDADAERSAEEDAQWVHPNEEQLMRIGDLQVDARLIMQTAMMIGFNPSDIPLDLAAIVPPKQGGQEDHDMASVSTETEDDPVNLAMRASLGATSADSFLEADDVEDDEEQIVWPGALANKRNDSIVPGSQGRQPTAQDLLQNLAIDRSSPGVRSAGPPTRRTSGTIQPSAPSPSLLFGASADKAGGGSIWTLTREESQKGVKRSSGTASTLNLQSIWSDTPGTQPLPLHHAPSQSGIPRATAQWGTPMSLLNTTTSGHGNGNGNGNGNRATTTGHGGVPPPAPALGGGVGASWSHTTGYAPHGQGTWGGYDAQLYQAAAPVSPHWAQAFRPS